MSLQRKSPKWVVRLRSGCPRGWSVSESRGWIRLVVRSGAGGSDSKVTKTLPIAWAADTVNEAIALISDLHSLVESGHDLGDALARVTGGAAPAAKPASSSQWPELLEKFHADLQTLSQIKDTTWKRNYAPYLERAVELLTSASAPVNARDLGSDVVATWADKPGSRHKAIDALRKFLDFCVEVHHLPASSWTLSDRVIKQLKGKRSARRTVACPTDGEILHLLDSLPKSDAGKRWWNAIALMALYGLRPVEINSVVVKENPETGELAMYCPRVKVSARGTTSPRWLMPLPLTAPTGEQLDWNLTGAMAIGQLPLPDVTSNKFSLRTFLMRQPAWVELLKQYEDRGEWLRGYSFRDAWSLRAHRAEHRLDTICLAMGHSLAVHQSSYEWSRDTDVLKHA